jgi:acetyltransferase-like isoleucine patch superfamily enzyme
MSTFAYIRAHIWRLFRLFSPGFVLSRLTSPIPPGLWIANVFFQRVLRINASVPWMVHFTSQANGDIRVGRKVWEYFARCGHCYFQGINGIRIGDDTIFGPGVKVISANHDLSNFDSHSKADPIVIGRHCWIGSNAVILPGVTLGNNVIVAAGAVVTESFPSNCMIAGVPARQIRNLVPPVLQGDGEGHAFGANNVGN